ncbi:MAG TPA: alkaline phosphatase family protein [Propionibacteriaceae bacterium]|nr:alkaline phosphatase family protein [Propionibacteriaceae bacterium]
MTVRRLRTSWPAILIATAFLAAGCHATPPSSGASPAAVTPAPPPATPSAAETSIMPHTADDQSTDDPINHVIGISIDGLNPRAIEELGKSRTPAFHRLMREGVFTLNARTVREKTSTTPNHTTMLTGRRVDAKHGGHGYTENFDNGGTIHQTAGHYVASVFDVVHDHGGSTAFFGAKSKFRLYKRTWNTHGARDRVGRNNGRAKIDRFTIDRNNTRLVSKVTAELRRKPRDFTFVHLSLPDRVGHASSFMGKQYLDAVRRTDRLVGRILNTVADRPELRRHTLVILTADHGGRGASHYNARRLQDFRIPFMAWGPRVPAGRNLYSLNPTFRSPGSSRTSYRGKQPIRNGDLANLATDALDLPPVPGSQFDSPRTLKLFR